ncbi:MULTISPECIES: hypothetical protein [unclassified Prochlorococcus]|uniref:hypothetical protein n=1 Tax=unclassified Prochlorococcus TaxID=2627481 RepID=UPI000533B272|nr:MULTISPECIES: hypothetical protein [unclassified Prochlorococcus]KGG25228.1 hypothetical protein EV12_2460 [Prochlorococcus sp. MIT 0701]KGG29249.1 hypothetical protein EV13_1198 [Prochlorococcus sp. MIT 0702]KGG35333.1 hypothetical protein EV14_0906 [Prochlorococcus sp. MIT 0703]
MRNILASNQITQEQEKDLSARRINMAIASGIAGASMAFLINLFLARSMQIEIFGEFSSCMGVLKIWKVVCALGMGTLATKIFKRNKSNRNIEESRGLRRTGPFLIIIASIITYIALVTSHAMIHDKTAVRLESFAAVLSVLPLVCLRQFFKASVAVHGAGVAASVIAGCIEKTIYILFIGSLIVIWKPPLGILLVTGAMASSLIISMLLLYILLFKSEPEIIKHGKPRYSVAKWAKTGFLLSLTTLGVAMLDNGGLVVLGWINADGTASAELAAAITLGTIYYVIAQSCASIFKPVLSEAAANRNQARVFNIFRLWYKHLAYLFLPSLTAMIITAPWLLNLFGQEFKGGIWTLIVCLIGYTITSFNLLFVKLYQYLGQEINAMKIMLIAAMLGILGMWGLGIIWSDLGVAIAANIALIGAQTLIAYLAWRAMGKWHTLPNYSTYQH